MKIPMKQHLLASCIFLTLMTSTFASVWPVFIAPDKTFLLDHGYIDTKHCPPGQGSLINNSVINIHDNVCRTYCPAEWNWITSSDETCRHLTDFDFARDEIVSVRDADGTTLYSVITIVYESNNARTTSTKLTFATPKEHWYCYVKNPELHLMTCANDI